MTDTNVAKRENGAGSIAQLGPKKWRVRVACGRRPDGRVRRVTKVVEGTRRDAEIAAANLAAEMGQKPNMGASMTLNDYFWGVYRSAHAPLLSNATWARYRSIWTNHVQDELGALRADAVKRAEVQSWVTGMTPTMAKEAYKVLKAVMRCAWDDELIDEEPLRRKVKLPQAQQPMVDAWDESEVLEAAHRLQGTRIEPLWLAIVGGGLRREEALALRVPDDFAFDTVSNMDGTEGTVCRVLVDKALTRLDGLKGTKTHRTRTVTISDPFASRLKDVIGHMGPGGLFRRVDGADMKPGSVPKAWARLFDEGGPLHGMRRVMLYTGRHSHETAASRAGVSDSLNSRIHGHSRMVEYSHYLVRSQDDADMAASAVAARYASQS